MLDLVAPIYRRLIYEFLSPQELVQLGETCKKIHYDQNRIEMMILKISSKFTYEIDKYYWRKTYLSYFRMPKYLVFPLVQEFKKRILSLRLEEIENLSFEDKRYLVIHFPTDLFDLSHIETQKEITLFVCDQLYHMWNYAEKRKMNMVVYDYRCPEEFDLYPFYNFIKNILQDIFLNGSEAIKYILIKKLIELSNITRNMSPKNKVGNDIDVMDFIDSLFTGDLNQIVEIIDIGLFIRKYFPGYLRDYLDNIIGSYVEINNDYEDTAYDIYAEDIEKKLDLQNEKYPDRTNAEVLDELLLECKLFSVSLVRETNKERHERYLHFQPR
jgi:hypothetical protein